MSFQFAKSHLHLSHYNNNILLLINSAPDCDYTYLSFDSTDDTWAETTFPHSMAAHTHARTKNTWDPFSCLAHCCVYRDLLTCLFIANCWIIDLPPRSSQDRFVYLSCAASRFCFVYHQHHALLADTQVQASDCFLIPSKLDRPSSESESTKFRLRFFVSERDCIVSCAFVNILLTSVSHLQKVDL